MLEKSTQTREPKQIFALVSSSYQGKYWQQKVDLSNIIPLLEAYYRINLYSSDENLIIRN